LAMRLEVPILLDGSPLADQRHFETLIGLANERLTENARRVARFWSLLREKLVDLDAVAEEVSWALACPQALTRAVKLAVEARGWADSSRKITPLSNDSETESNAASCLRIPITAAGAAVLHAMADEWLGLPQHELSRAASEWKIDSGASLPKGKANRPTTEAADLECLWKASQMRGDLLRLVQGAHISEHSRQGAQKDSRNAEGSAAIAQVVSQLHQQLGQEAAGIALDELLKDVQAVGHLQWRGDCALLPRGALAGGAWARLATMASKFGGLWESIRISAGARLLARQREIRVDDEVRGAAVEVLAGTGDGWVVVPGPLTV